MEKRYTSKDFVMLGLLLGLGLLLILLMYQVDRQWSRMAEMQRTLQEQGDDLRRIRGAVQGLDARLRAGVVAPGAGEGPADADAVPEAFARAFEASQQPDFATGDWLVRAFPTGLSTLTPLVSSDAYASEVQSYVLESLLVRDPDTLEWQGLLARDWAFSDDGLTITFQLRQGLEFSDGEPLTADDVVFTYEFIMNDDIAAPRARAFLEKLEKVEALGEHEVAFTFSEPYFNSLSLAGGMQVMPRHFYEPYLDEPRRFNESRGLLLGSGPYRLSDPKGWTPDAGMVELQRNPRYWGPVDPPFNRLLWRVIENDSARLTTFRNQDIDLYTARPREYRQLLEDERLQARTQHFEFMSPTGGYTYIGWNQRRNDEPTRFADRRVRLAMTHLTDMERVIDEIMLGYAEVAISPFNPRSPQHDSSLEPHEFSVDKARALLEEAGFEDRNGDGILQGPDGKRFEFDMVFFQDNEDTRRMVLFLRDLYARAGILMRPRPTEWSVMLDLLNRKDFDAITLGWTSGVEIDVYQMFHSSQTVSGGDNFISYENPELDALIEKARATVDEEERMAIWHQVQRVLHEDQPYTFLMRRQTLAFVDDRLANLKRTRLGLNLGTVPLEIYVPIEQQRHAR
ncbi:peptide-binding protein [Ectothiorhodospira variabilis]|uniref:peptide-binding protein n=1 Tax=Ectothiorhodospira variabilis TaxID=505694 RepID=UPI001EFA72C7|nr:peptide-binding protein [Ectothiorhodospira variabilis]MCG5493227.1 ABC transporter substrate-binding protein [Ectothiorhodospira variabilis]MCG5502556.1 ABC transporter substrate-binding protein [Ectothiorhodospira variabilis]MCG5505678.1 ABC transporter substrate-binding protein [Ectothiorhodospira variabilis]